MNMSLTIPPRRLALGLGVLVALLGGVVAVGCAFDIPALQTIFTGLTRMRTGTAAGLMVAGTALALLSVKNRSVNTAAIAGTLAACVALVGAGTLAHYLWGWRIEAMFGGALETVPPVTAFCLVLTGLSLTAASLSVRARWRTGVLCGFALSLVAVGGLALLGYVSEASVNANWWNYSGISMIAALGFVLIGAGLLAYVNSEGELAWWLDKTSTVGLVAAVAVMLTAVGISADLTKQLREATGWVGHTYEVLREIERLGVGMSDLEGSQRGYIILGEDRLLASRERSLKEIRESVRNLRQLTADNPGQQSRLDRLEPMMAARTAFGEQTIAARRSQGFEAAQRMLATNKGIDLTLQIKTVLQSMLAEERVLRAEREQRAVSASAANLLLLPLGAFASLTMLAMGVFMLNSVAGDRAHSESRLKSSLAEIGDLRAALDEHAIVATTDPQGKITFVNDKFCAISKYAREELLGRDHRLINSGYHPKEFIRDLWTTIGRGHVWHGEMKNRAKDGSSYWVDTTIVPFLDERGKPRQYVAIRADISERKRAQEALQESEELFSKAFRFSPDGVAIMRQSDRTIVRANETLCRLWGCTPESVVGRSSREFSDWMHNDECPDREVELPMSDGRRFYFTISSRLITLQGENCVLSVVRDITERKSAEQKINQLNTELEQRVVARTAELEEANKELEAFSYSVSHDLRSPLRTVDGFSQAVLEDYGPLLPPEGREDLQTIREGAQRMGALIDDLLTFSRLGRQAVRKRKVNVNGLVEETLAELKPQCEGRELDIQIETLPFCEGDPALLKQVWINLLSNALKYTRKRERTRIEVGFSIGEDGIPVYFVRDNGTGFDMEFAHKLFGVFQRLHRAEDYEGTGVGLAIVKRIIQRHDGRVWAEAVQDEGATFYFTLSGNTTS